MAARHKLSDEALGYTAMRFGRPGPNELAGAINRADAAFLFDMIMRARPRAIAEIGVASGISTAFLATLLGDRLRESRLYSFDAVRTLPGDPPKPVGACLFELFGELPANLTLAAGVASTEIRSWPQCPQDFDFVFLDAHHGHPWPCNDLLSILDLIVPGSWVVLHDVWLPIVNRKFQTFGPLYLYQTWPGEKCTPSGDGTNIGAIRLFDDPADSAAALIQCCTIPWQVRLPHSGWAGALDALSRIDADRREGLRAILERPLLAKHPVLRDCEIAVRGVNQWSHFAADPTSEPFVLHANRPGEPVLSLAIRGLARRTCNGIVFPSIVRSGEASCPIGVRLALRAHGAAHEAGCSLMLRDDTVQFAYLRAGDCPGEVFDAEISVSVTEQAENMKGAWVKFEAMHFV